jgi:tape measure domain-containing protein
VAVSNVELRVDARNAVTQLNRASAATNKLDGVVRNMNGRLQDSKGRFVASGNAARQTGGAFNSLAQSVKSAAIGYASFATAQSIVNTAISREESERRIQLLAKGYGEVEQLSKAAANASVRFGQSQTTANQALAGVYARLRPVGTSLEEIVSTYNGFNTAARLSGATAVEAENAFTQLAQALGSGALRGDEFNSISEQVPGILTAISKETGVAQGKLRAYAADGMITADIVIRALQRIEKEGADQLEEALKGPEQQLKNVTNRTEDLQVAIGRLALPAVLAVVDDLASSAERWAGTIDNLSVAFSGLSAFLNPVIEKLSQINDLISNINPLMLALNTIPGLSQMMVGEQSQLPQPIKNFDQLSDQQIQQALALAGVKPPAVDSKGAKVAKERADMSEAMFALEQKRQSLAFSNNELLKIELDRQIEVQRIMESSMLPRERTIALQESTNQALKRGAQVLKPMIKGVEELQQGAKDAGTAFAELFIAADNKKLVEQAAEMGRLYSAIGDSIQTGIVDSLTAAVEGTKSLADVASDTLKSIANILLQFGVQTALAGLGGGNPASIFTKLFGGGRASGGTVSAGTSYVVGERGPELFTPGRSGSIAPNNALGGSNIVVNVDAGGTNAQGNGQNAKQLGAAIGAAVQAELIKQQRPGGLLAR